MTHPAFTFHIPKYEPGTLNAIGYIKGEKVAHTERLTPGKPSNIILNIDLSGRELQKGSNDVVFLHASILDQNGTVIPNDNKPVKFNIEGDAVLIGDNPINAEAGIATILLQKGDKPGIIKISATAEGINATNLEIKVK